MPAVDRPGIAQIIGREPVTWKIHVGGKHRSQVTQLREMIVPQPNADCHGLGRGSELPDIARYVRAVCKHDEHLTRHRALAHTDGPSVIAALDFHWSEFVKIG